MTVLKRLSTISVLCAVLVLAVTGFSLESIVPLSAYAAEVVDINTATADQLMLSVSIWVPQLKSSESGNLFDR